MEKTVEMTGGGATAPAPAGATREFRVKPDQILFFNRQLASMARLNMPLAKGLRILAREVSDPEFKGLLESIQRDLDDGMPLQNALMKYPSTFSTLYVEMMRAGESTGNLAATMDQITSYQEAMIRIKTRVRDAVLYPVVMSFVIMGFTLFFLSFVAPQFEAMLAGANEAQEAPMDLPFLTRMLFFLSHVVTSWPFWILFPPIVVVTGVSLFRKFRVMGDRYDDVLFQIPLFGKLFLRATLMKVTRTMRDYLKNGVSMVQTLRLTSRTIGDNRVRKQIEDLLKAVEEGGSFSRNLSAGAVFPDTMVWKLQMAEEKGVIEDALKDLSNEFEAEVEEQTSIITKVLSPLLLLGMGVIVFLLFMAAFVPLTQLYSAAG
jgi:type II secretory pathway component PulF